MRNAVGGVDDCIEEVSKGLVAGARLVEPKGEMSCDSMRAQTRLSINTCPNVR